MSSRTQTMWARSENRNLCLEHVVSPSGYSRTEGLQRMVEIQILTRGIVCFAILFDSSGDSGME